MTEVTSPRSTQDISPVSDDLQEALELIKNTRRFLAIKCAVKTDIQSSKTLAKHIAAITHGKPPKQVNASEQQRVYVSLYQTHLPKLHNAGIIDYDKRSGCIQEGQHLNKYHELITTIQEVTAFN